MRKIPTLFKRDPEDMRRVLPEVTPGCEWVLAGEGRPTRKYDGMCVMFDGERWWARREVKPGKEPPAHYQAIETDEATGKTVGWEPIEQSPFARFHAEAVEPYGSTLPAGTYELYGPKINGNPEGAERHRLIVHGGVALADGPRDYTTLRKVLAGDYPYEGIVWHHRDGRLAKLKRRDFFTDTEPLR